MFTPGAEKHLKGWLLTALPFQAEIIGQPLIATIITWATKVQWRRTYTRWKANKQGYNFYVGH